MAVEVGHVLSVGILVGDCPALRDVLFGQLERRAQPHLAGESLREGVALEAAAVGRDGLPALVLDEVGVVERGLGLQEIGAGVEAAVPLDDRLLEPLGAALLLEFSPAVPPEAGDVLRMTRAVVPGPLLVDPAVDLRRAPGGVHEADRDVERPVELPAHPVERRAVLAHRVVGRGLPVDADRVLARKRRVPVVAVVHEKRADVGVALRLLEELLAADREASVACERVGHVGLPAAEPDVAEEHVGNRDVRGLRRPWGLWGRWGRQGGFDAVRSAGGHRGEFHGPAAGVVRGGLAHGEGLLVALLEERDADDGAGFGEAPHGRFDLALEDGVVGDHGRELEVRGGGEAGDQGRGEEDEGGDAFHGLVVLWSGWSGWSDGDCGQVTSASRRGRTFRRKPGCRRPGCGRGANPGPRRSPWEP